MRLQGAALHEQALHREERRQIAVARLQLLELGLDAEQGADEILDMSGEVEDELRFRLLVE